MNKETISEEQILHNELSFEINQELIHLMKRIVKLQRENKLLKEEINKISKKELKVRDMLYSIENGTLTRERLMQIEEALFELGENNEQ